MKPIRFFYILPLFIINLFNLILIITEANLEDYLRKVIHLAVDYFFGFHLIPFFIALSLCTLLFLIKKTFFRFFLYQLVLVFFLFLLAINVALFSEINEGFKADGFGLQVKKNSSLNGAIKKSPARAAEVVKSYLQMDELLSGKILVIPSPSLLEKDFLFKIFIHYTKIQVKKYNYSLSGDTFELLALWPSKAFQTFRREFPFKSYMVLSGYAHTEKYYFFIYNKKGVFVPSMLASKLSLIPHD
jgi:hypothetical protein